MQSRQDDERKELESLLREIPSQTGSAHKSFTLRAQRRGTHRQHSALYALRSFCRAGWRVTYGSLLPFQLEANGFLLHGSLHIDSIEGQRTTAELGHVETLEVHIVELRVLLRQHKRFVGMPQTVDIAEIGLAIESVVALAGKDKPPAVARPGVIGVASIRERPACPVRVRRGCRRRSSCSRTSSAARATTTRPWPQRGHNRQPKRLMTAVSDAIYNKE